MHECVCGHGPDLHEDLKRCGGECVDSEYGACVCPIYQHEEDE